MIKGSNQMPNAVRKGVRGQSASVLQDNIPTNSKLHRSHSSDSSVSKLEMQGQTSGYLELDGTSLMSGRLGLSSSIGPNLYSETWCNMFATLDYHESKLSSMAQLQCKLLGYLQQFLTFK